MSTERQQASRGPALKVFRLDCRVELEEAARLLGLSVPELQELEAGAVVRFTTRQAWKDALDEIWKARRCALEGCRDKVSSRDLCSGHYKQHYRDGKLTPKRAYRGREEKAGP